MGTHPVRAISVCSGVEGLGLGLDLALGGLLRTVLYVEVEAFAVSRLAQAMDSGFISEAPVWSNLHTLTDPEPLGFVRRACPDGIDLLFGGIPCQPWSVAGKGLGKSDERDLWEPTRAAIEVYSPSWVFLENVPGVAVPDGLGRWDSDLRAMGYVVTAGLFSAEEVGAPHGRLRLFVLAHKHGEGPQGRQAEPRGSGRARSHGDELADSPRDREPGRDGERRRGERVQRVGGEDVRELAHPGPDAGRSEHGEQLQEPCAGAGEPVGALGNAEVGQDDERGPGSLGETQSGRRRIDPAVDDAERNVGYAERDGGERRRRRRDMGRQEGEGQGDWQERERNGRATHDSMPATLADDERGRRAAGSPRAGRSAGLAAEDGDRELPLFPPGPADARAWQRVCERAPSLEPAVCRMADGMADRVDRLRACGNGVLPLAAAYAFCSLYADLTE